MRLDRLKEFVLAAPFLPFRLFLSNGSTCYVPHPEFVYFSRDVLIVTGVKNRRDGLPRTITCIPLHVTHAEVVETR